MIAEVFTCDLCGQDSNDIEFFQKHLEECDYKTIDCDNDCGVSEYRCEIDKHKTRECARRSVECEHCHQKYIALSIKDHYRYCPKMLIECPNKCEAINVVREQLQIHLDSVCSVSTVPCDFKYAQCLFRGTKKSVENHIIESCSQHLLLLGAMVVKKNQQLIQLHKQLEETIEKLSLNTQNQINSLKPNVMYVPGYIWKINDWSKKMNDAKSYTNKTIYSPEFYTHPHGYKIKVALCPDGFGTHISVYIHIVPGEYDGIINWPFILKVKFTILDQNGNTNHTKSVDPTNPNPDLYYNKKYSFQRPQGSHNLSFGFHKFVSHEQLDDGKFIKDNAIYMKLEFED